MGFKHSKKIRNGRERGLYARAAKSGLAFPCPITWISLPMKKDPDDAEFEILQWPILLPYDFVLCSVYYKVIFCWPPMLNLSIDNPQKWFISATMLGFQAATLISEGYLSGLVSDWSTLPSYWRGMLRDFPNHPVKDLDPGLCASAGCTLYGFLGSIL